MAYADALERYRKLVSTIPDVELKGATMPYTSLNGNMFSYLGKDGKVALRLAAADREGFLAKHNAKLREAYGTVQPAYVEVPDALLASTGKLKEYFAASYEYISSLKAKPTTRKKPVTRKRSSADYHQGA